MKVVKLCLFFLSNIVLACSPHFDSSEDLSEYLKKEDSGLSKVKNIGEVMLAVTYRPTDLLVARLIIYELNMQNNSILFWAYRLKDEK